MHPHEVHVELDLSLHMIRVCLCCYFRMFFPRNVLKLLCSGAARCGYDELLYIQIVLSNIITIKELPYVFATALVSANHNSSADYVIILTIVVWYIFATTFMW